MTSPDAAARVTSGEVVDKFAGEAIGEVAGDIASEAIGEAAPRVAGEDSCDISVPDRDCSCEATTVGCTWRCRCAAGGGNAWLDHEDFWALAYGAGLRSEDKRWMDAFENLCLEEGCDVGSGICGEVVVRLLMDELVTRCQQTSTSLRAMLQLIRPTEEERVGRSARSRNLATGTGAVPPEQRLQTLHEPQLPQAGEAEAEEADEMEANSELEGVTVAKAFAEAVSDIIPVYEGDIRQGVLAQSPTSDSRGAADTAEVSGAPQVDCSRRSKSRGRRAVAEERVLAELDKFKITACAKPSKGKPSGGKLPRRIEPAPFDPLFQLEATSSPTSGADQDWQSMLRGVFELELQGCSPPSEQ